MSATISLFSRESTLIDLAYGQIWKQPSLESINNETCNNLFTTITDHLFSKTSWWTPRFWIRGRIYAAASKAIDAMRYVHAKTAAELPGKTGRVAQSLSWIANKLLSQHKEDCSAETGSAIYQDSQKFVKNFKAATWDIAIIQKHLPTLSIRAIDLLVKYSDENDLKKIFGSPDSNKAGCLDLLKYKKTAAQAFQNIFIRLTPAQKNGLIENLKEGDSNDILESIKNTLDATLPKSNNTDIEASPGLITEFHRDILNIWGRLRAPSSVNFSDLPEEPGDHPRSNLYYLHSDRVLQTREKKEIQLATGTIVQIANIFYEDLKRIGNDRQYYINGERVVKKDDETCETFVNRLTQQIYALTGHDATRLLQITNLASQTTGTDLSCDMKTNKGIQVILGGQGSTTAYCITIDSEQCKVETELRGTANFWLSEENDMIPYPEQQQPAIAITGVYDLNQQKVSYKLGCQRLDGLAPPEARTETPTADIDALHIDTARPSAEHSSTTSASQPSLDTKANAAVSEIEPAP